MYTFKNPVCVFDSPLKSSCGVHIDREKKALDKKKVVVVGHSGGGRYLQKRDESRSEKKKKKNKHFSVYTFFYFVGFIVSIFPFLL